MTYSEGIKPASRSESAPPKTHPLWEGHRERLRQRMEREGWHALKPYEMLELVLFHAVPRQDLSDVSRLLVDRFGSVGGVFGASRDQLLAVEGVTAGLAEWIALTAELMRAYCDLQGEEDTRLGCYQEVRAFLEKRMKAWQEAGFWVLYADFSFHLITYSGMDGAAEWWDAANARRMMAEAIGNGARYVYMVLYTAEAPRGIGAQDMERLEAIAVTLRAADLDLVDCLLVGGGEIYSSNIHGKMNAIRAESGCMQLHEHYGDAY